MWRSDKFNQREFLVSQTWGIWVVFAGSCHETSTNRPYICVQLTAMWPGTGRHRLELLYDKERNTTRPLWRDMVHCLNLCTKDNARSQMCQCLLPLTKRQYVGRCHIKRVGGRRNGRVWSTQRWRGTSRRYWLNAPRLLSWEQELALGELYDQQSFALLNTWWGWLPCLRAIKYSSWKGFEWNLMLNWLVDLRQIMSVRSFSFKTGKFSPKKSWKACFVQHSNGFQCWSCKHGCFLIG